MSRLFEIFVEMLDDVPPRGIRRVVEMEQAMLEADVSEKRVGRDRDVNSILAFCRFLQAVDHGGTVAPVEMPVLHIVRYRSILLRMIQAGELPAEAQKKFDGIVESGFWRLMVN
jgi:hypothetical protein